MAVKTIMSNVKNSTNLSIDHVVVIQTDGSTTQVENVFAHRNTTSLIALDEKVFQGMIGNLRRLKLESLCGQLKREIDAVKDIAELLELLQTNVDTLAVNKQIIEYAEVIEASKSIRPVGKIDLENPSEY